MSLFGGSLPPIQSPEESDNSQPSVDLSPQPQSAQNAQTAPHALDPDIDLSTASHSESDNEGSDEEPPTRSNRFTGHPQTWKGYTAADRQIALSLEQIQQTDLAAHLYNAHALKRRVRRPAEEIAEVGNWQSKDNWLKTGSDLQYADVSGEIQKELVPSKDWTAWPLAPSKVSASGRMASKSNPPEAHGDWIIGGAGTQDAGKDLREELLAVFLRLAKGKWEARDSEDDAQRGRDRPTISRSRSRSRSVVPTKLRRSGSRHDVEMKDDDDIEKSNGEPQKENDDEHFNPGIGKKRGRKSQHETSFEPTISADDARAERLLRPIINSMLSKLDDLALAVRRTRLNHFGRGGSSDRSSMSEFTSGVESDGSRSGSSTKNRSRSATSRKASARPSSRASSMHTSHKAKIDKTTPRVRNEATDTDLASSNASDSGVAKSTSQKRKRRRSVSITSENSASTNRDWSGRAGLLDWSEILGIAAVKGWNERAVARTAQRCATLFGESMSFMPLAEGHPSKPVSESLRYVPSTIPAPDVLPVSGPSMSRRPFFQVGTLRCPHLDCYGHEKGFALPYRVVEHCMRVHGYDPRTNDSDNEERTVGGVHIDGFLQPVTSKPGWLGHGRSKADKASKKQKVGEEESADPPDAVGTIDEDSKVLKA